ncbi:MAG: PorT family protein [Bacteroidales bacterium]|nr:PorT family protein [Bacteroidales bacterium]
MKKIYLLFLFFTVLELTAQNFNGGFFAGPLTSQVDGDRLSGYDKSSFHFGFFTNRYFNNNMGFQMELKYIGKGSRKNIDVNKGITNFYLLKLQYIEVPIMLLFKYNDKFTFSAGASYGVLLKAQEDSDGNGFIEPFNPYYKGFEVAGQASFFYSLGEFISAEFRFSYSLLPIRPYPGNQSYYLDAGQKNNLLSLAIYYTFDNQDFND